MPGYLKRLRKDYPGIRRSVKTGTGRDRLAWLRGYEVAVAFGAMDVVPPDLLFHFTLSSRYVVITPEDHALAGRESVEPAEVVEHSIITLAAEATLGGPRR